MTDRTKKILLTLIILIVAIIFAVILYFLFFRAIITPTPPAVTPPITPPTGLPVIPPAVNIPPAINVAPTLPAEIPSLPAIPTAALPTYGPTISPVAVGGLTTIQTLEANPTKNPTLASNGRDLIYYDSNKGVFTTITSEGEKKIYSEEIFKNVDKVTWAPNSQKAVLEYPDGSNIIYDFKLKKSVTLPSYWKDFNFSPDSQKIAFKDMKYDIENRYLSMADTNGGSYKQLEQIGDKDSDVTISWSPNNQYVAMYRKTVDSAESDVFPVGFNRENFTKFTIEGRDFRYVWSPSGDKMLYSAYNSNSNYNPTLWAINANPDIIGSGRKAIQLQTWADKCVFAAETTVYCAVPRALDTGSGFRPDLADSTPDDIYKIDLMSGAKELAAQPVIPSTIDKLIVSTDGKTLYWLEKSSNQLKKINL